jgi:hypothetical protein
MVKNFIGPTWSAAGCRGTTGPAFRRRRLVADRVPGRIAGAGGVFLSLEFG